jgi:NAD(P)-dependent dehydrogenase (short-subunit alcohol dehydrogenase family)
MKNVLLLGAAGAALYSAYRAMRPRFDFCGKHVVITGGSRGLGLALARQLAAMGARLSICSRDPEELRRALAQLDELKAHAIAVECDVTDRDRVREFLSVVRRQNGPVDVLINNAGIIRVGPLEVMEEADFDQSLQTHFWAAFNTSMEVIPEMKARKQGRIVNISSIGGKIAVPHLAAYSTGKFALVGFSSGLRSELAPHGIKVTTVCPGLMRTGSHINADFKGRHAEEYAWFAMGNGLPGLSMSADCAARKIIDACALGDAEAILGVPAKLAVAMQAISPNLMSSALALVNRHILPDAGGIGTSVVKGWQSRGKTPSTSTILTDRAAFANNEIGAATLPPPIS